jgi:peptidoglycan/LPS O-acetylase OafA/YrhL
MAQGGVPPQRDYYPPRDYYIDRLRSVMTALVIFHHTSITYGAIGGWFWREIEPARTPAGLVLILFCSTNQAYFMGFFFLLAGYFTPASLERKGYGRFILDRFLRLGLPLLAFGLILGPLTAAIVNAWKGDGFWITFLYLWNHKEFINGPLWFAQALLIFSLVYCAWRAARGPALTASTRIAKPVPSYLYWLLGALAVAVVSLAVRQFVPVGVNVFGLQLGYFPGYIYLFAIGLAAWRHDWLRQLGWRNARPWLWTALIAWPILPVGVTLIRAHAGLSTNTAGGFSLASTLYALWEPFVAWGIIAAWLLVFRARMNAPSAIWNWLNRRAYAVYILHPPVLVAITLMLHPWAAPALLKFAVAGTLACIGTWLVADPFVRLPGFRNIV